jgi:hypothetical protein
MFTNCGFVILETPAIYHREALKPYSDRQYPNTVL